MPCEIWLKTEIISSALSFGDIPLPSGADFKTDVCRVILVSSKTISLSVI